MRGAVTRRQGAKVMLIAFLAGYPFDMVFGHFVPWFLYRSILIGLVAMMAFALVERWWLRVAAVAVSVPLTTFLLWFVTTPSGAPPFWEVENRLLEFGVSTALGLLLAPWVAMIAVLRETDLERIRLERQAIDARLHLMQAQVSPHFLFNTLANIQAMVETGSPRAPGVLRSLIAYLRAAVPRLGETDTTLGQELDLVGAYLELMHMRMPDRLVFTVQGDADLVGLRCPPMTVLTLVENAVRHGIDPSEEGGRIDIAVERRGARCLVRVSDTGVGFREASGGLGTGLATLRERLKLGFGGQAELRLSEQSPHGVLAELELPLP